MREGIRGLKRNDEAPMATASTLSQQLETHDPDGAGHAQRVTALALRLAEALRASDHRVEAIRAGGPLHDVGKLEVASSILQKPGPLAPDELETIRRHPVVGAHLLHDVEDAQGGLDCVLYHHEWWNGTGYPHGLAGGEIPFEARILAVADAYDAMTFDRPYRAALTTDEAMAEVERCAGSQFDPQIAEALLALDNSS
ncbi:MAG TPA: HD-GYP domain-containing protein [Gaiellaceae bacterium]|jgi:HD-GYP domain-containing protein (c-di-GMP phosphodiesterase class II)|nr:HD-GYP domain-containing protein [Gaiellaceae bacterium]